MSNAKTYQGKAESIVVHYTTARLRLVAPVAGGADGWNATSARNRSRVTCKRCLATLATQGRAFQRKASGWFAPAVKQARALYAAWPGGHVRAQREVATRAIAREEGRAS
jgi:hypothetical protein